MTDLADFLLARIAEDQAAATDEVERLRGAPRRGGKTTAARRWAECEAKRRIVERAAMMAVHYAPANPYEWEPLQYQAQEADEELGSWLLAALAAPYADHPDYRQEWRP